jgi:hypothetical protein
MDVASFMGNLNSSNSNVNVSRSVYETPGGAYSTSKSRPHSAPKERPSKTVLTEEERQERENKFKEFLGRQAQSVIRKENTAEKVLSE